jgi:hypothetical protein
VLNALEKSKRTRALAHADRSFDANSKISDCRAVAHLMRSGKKLHVIGVKTTRTKWIRLQAIFSTFNWCNQVVQTKREAQKVQFKKLQRVLGKKTHFQDLTPIIWLGQAAHIILGFRVWNASVQSHVPNWREAVIEMMDNYAAIKLEKSSDKRTGGGCTRLSSMRWKIHDKRYKFNSNTL